MEGVFCYGDESVGRKRHQWLSLLETLPLSINSMLHPTVQSFLQQQPHDVFYQHENTRQCQHIRLSIDYLWDVMDHHVQQHPQPLANQQELIQAHKITFKKKEDQLSI